MVTPASAGHENLNQRTQAHSRKDRSIVNQNHRGRVSLSACAACPNSTCKSGSLSSQSALTSQRFALCSNFGYFRTPDTVLLTEIGFCETFCFALTNSACYRSAAQDLLELEVWV